MDGRYSASWAGLTRAFMMRRKSKILATDHLRCLMDCRVKPGNDAGAAIHMDGRYSASCAGLTRAFMMRRKSNILATDRLRCLMDCRVKPGNDGQDAGAAIHMDGRYSASCAGLTRASMMRRKSKILATDHLRCLMDGRVKPAHDAQYRPIARDIMAGLVPAIPIHVALPCPPKRDRRNKSGDDRMRRLPPSLGGEAGDAAITWRMTASRAGFAL